MMSSLAVWGLIAPWKSMARSISGPAASRNWAKWFAALSTKAFVSMIREGFSLWTPVLKQVNPCAIKSPMVAGSAAALVKPNPVPRGTAQHLVYRYAQSLARKVPQRLFHPAERAGQYRSAPVESVTVHGLPVVDNPGRVLADQVTARVRPRPGRRSSPDPPE